jgi:hypothetical protein
MLQTTGTRKNLEKAHSMVLIGAIPLGFQDVVQFNPAYCVHPLINASVVVGGSKPAVCPDDEVEMVPEFIPLGGSGEDLVCTINNAQLLVHQHDTTLMLRNVRPFPAQTLLDVLTFNPAHYTINCLDPGSSMILKEGDVLLVKHTSNPIIQVTARNPGPNKIRWQPDFVMYVCIPAFATPQNAIAVFQRQGFVRDIRLRVEMFLGLWTVEWDAALGRAVYAHDRALKQQYRNQSFQVIKRVAGWVTAPGCDCVYSEDGGASSAEEEEEEAASGEDATKSPAAKRQRV